jgi:hypothetical protein
LELQCRLLYHGLVKRRTGAATSLGEVLVFLTQHARGLAAKLGEKETLQVVCGLRLELLEDSPHGLLASATARRQLPTRQAAWKRPRDVIGAAEFRQRGIFNVHHGLIELETRMLRVARREQITQVIRHRALPSVKPSRADDITDCL